MFSLNQQQLAKLNKWIESHDPKRYCGAIGGRYTYCFTPTSLGTIIKVQDDVLKIEIDLSEYQEM